jgi:hypothetical protein
MYLLKIEYLGTIRSNKLEIQEEFLKIAKERLVLQYSHLKII